MNPSSKNRAGRPRLGAWLPWLLGGITLTLLTVAALPLLSTPQSGGYESMAGYAFIFPQDAGREAAAPAVAEAIRRRFTPPEAEALLARIMAERLSSEVEAAAKAASLRRARAVARRKKRAAAKKAASAPKPVEKEPAAARSETRRTSVEAVRERFEADLRKFPLDERVWSGGLSLHLAGIAKWDEHYAVKLAVSNRTPGDFFVKAVVAQTAGGAIEGFPLFPMLVEKGRTRDGFLLFAAPARGAEVKILVKEDGGEDRVLRAPVRYPF